MAEVIQILGASEGFIVEIRDGEVYLMPAEK